MVLLLKLFDHYIFISAIMVYILGSYIKKIPHTKTPTLSTDADSKTDTNLKRKRLTFFFIPPRCRRRRCRQGAFRQQKKKKKKEEKKGPSW